MLKSLSVAVILGFSAQSFSMDLGSCRVISGVGAVVGVVKEVVDFSADKFLSNGEPKHCKPLYKHVLLSAAVRDDWETRASNWINKMRAVPRWILKAAKWGWDISSFAMEILVGTECFYLFRLGDDTPSGVERGCAIAGAVASAAVTLGGAVKIWSYVWPLFRRSDKNWVKDRVTEYFRRRDDERRTEANKDDDDKSLF